ncbi:hypothetical protein [Parathermosynechococcus lividus]
MRACTVTTQRQWFHRDRPYYSDWSSGEAKVKVSLASIYTPLMGTR